MWGIRPDHKPEPWWGARAIYRGGDTFDLVHDRMAREGKGPEVRALTLWLDGTGLAAMKAKLREERMTARDEREVRIEQDGYVLVANPRMSCGYLYIGAWRAQ